MAAYDVPDPTTPAEQQNFAILIQVSEGVASVTVRLREQPGVPFLLSAPFDPSDFTAPQKATNQQAIGLLLTLAKTRIEGFAAAAGHTVNWTVPA